LVSLPNVKSFTHFLATAETAASMPVKEIMRYGVITVSPDESISRVMHLMTRNRVRHMPVLRNGKARRYHQHR
jgi:CBS domain-containing protein